MCKCTIQWIKHGKPTPDNNPAIGRVRTIDRFEQIDGRGVHFPASDWYPICKEHAERLNEKGMHIWLFEPFADPITNVESWTGKP
jgi:hypothetical protein